MESLSDTNDIFELICSTESLKSESELQLWETPEDLSECEKAVLFFTNGFTEQKLWAISNLRETFGSSDLLKSILTNITDLSESLQHTCGDRLASLIEEDVLPVDYFPQVMEATLALLSFYSHTLHMHWLPVFECLLPKLNPPALSDTISEIVQLSDPSQKDITRKVAARLAKQVCRLLKEDTPFSLVSRAKSLSQDVAVQVRKSIAGFWGPIMFKTQRLNESASLELLKLLKDENQAVRRASAKVYLQCFAFFPRNQASKYIQTCVIPEIYHTPQLFPLLLTNAFEAAQEEVPAVLDHMLVASAESRQVLAFNFPCVATVIGFNLKVRKAMEALFNTEAKPALAKGLHEVLKLNPSSKAIKNIALNLLDDPELQWTLFKNAKDWISCLGPSLMLGSLIKAFGALKQWRQQIEMIKIIENVLGEVSMVEVLDQFVPLLIHKMLTSVCTLRKAAAESLAAILHATYYISRKFSIFTVVMDKFCRSNSSSDRMTFLAFVKVLLPLQSAKFLKMHFWEGIFKLRLDPVPGVRIALAQILDLVSENLYFECSSEIAVMIEALLDDHTIEVRILARKASDKFHSPDFVAHMHSVAVQEDQTRRASREDQQEKEEAKEAEDEKQRMVSELTAKAYMDLKFKGSKTYNKGRVPMNVVRKGSGTLKDSKSVTNFKNPPRKK